MSHTPGQWVCHLGDPSAKCDCASVLGEGQRGMGAIATVHYKGDGTHGEYEDEYELRETAEANARLIAAAPDLLEALRELIAMDEAQVFVKDPWDASFVKAKAAVAKAGGAS